VLRGETGNTYFIVFDIRPWVVIYYCALNDSALIITQSSVEIKKQVSKINKKQKTNKSK
jgi:hypothetical protein